MTFRIITNGFVFRVERMRKFFGLTYWSIEYVTDESGSSPLEFGVLEVARKYIEKEKHKDRSWKEVERI